MTAPIGNRNAARAAEWTATVGVALHRVRLHWVGGKGRLSDLARYWQSSGAPLTQS
jgi:hypothetical protein